jgi:hypothetical protein
VRSPADNGVAVAKEELAAVGSELPSVSDPVNIDEHLRHLTDAQKQRMLEWFNQKDKVKKVCNCRFCWCHPTDGLRVSSAVCPIVTER